MKVFIASDHRGLITKEEVSKYLKENNIEVLEIGLENNEFDDYPDFAFKLGRLVNENEGSLGILICGNGIGMSIAANKIKGIRCAKVDSVEDVKATRIDNDANIIAFGEKTPLEDAIKYIEVFINTPCSLEEKHQRRRNKIKEYEEK